MLNRADRVIPERQATHLLSALILMRLITEVIVKLTQKRLKELLNYDPETGIFTWLKNKGRAEEGQSAGCLNSKGYFYIGIDGKSYNSSILAWLYMEGYLPENDVDHRNRIRHDDRWENLRHVSKQCNARNRSIQKNNKSGISGVYWHKFHQKWAAQIAASGKILHLGYFNQKLDAAKARWLAEIKYNYSSCNTTSSAFLYLQSKGV